ncbi:choice-of-anchor W domain-containing protein [Haladaptatus sp. CMAA 1911]|uniref:choice-of-anchor W domain-containing protein n=1 Tax=unclassified Haladaptatus TaxID=2622732 RepID=UPI0037549143
MGGRGTATYTTSDSAGGSTDQGTLDLKLQGADADRLPADGDLVLASGGSYVKRTRLTNDGSVDGESVGLAVSTVTTDEGTTESGESNTSTGDGGELDDELQLKASLERNGTSIGYFFGSTSSFASYATAASGPEQTIGLSSPLDSTPTDFVLELFYPSGSTAALGDRLVFDLDVTLNSGVSSTGWRDVDTTRVALQAGGGQAADPVVTTLTQQEYSSVTMEQAFLAQGRVGGPGSGVTEHRLGPTVNNPKNRANKDWQNNETRPFTLTYDPQTQTVVYGNQGVGDLTYAPSDTGPYTDLLLYAIAPSSSTTQLNNLRLNGRQLGQNIQISNGGAAIRVSNVSLEEGFTLRGNARMQWSGNKPSQDTQFYRLRVGRVTSAMGTVAADSDERTPEPMGLPPRNGPYLVR